MFFFLVGSIPLTIYILAVVTMLRLISAPVHIVRDFFPRLFGIQDNIDFFFLFFMAAWSWISGTIRTWLEHVLLNEQLIQSNKVFPSESFFFFALVKSYFLLH